MHKRERNRFALHVRYLRRKLEDIKPGRIIQTIRGIGFALRVDE